MEIDKDIKDTTETRSKLKSIVVGNEIHTDVYERVAKEPNPVKIIVVPGNPGVATFYIKFVDTLYDELNGRYTITAIAHAGHSNAKKNKDRVFTLEDQIDHKAHFVDTFEKDSQFIFIGHSIGSYMILKLLKRRPDIRVHSAYHLFPTFTHLWKGFSPTTKVIVQPGVRHFLATLIHFIPTSLVNYLLNFYPGLPAEAKYVVTDSMYYYNVMNILSMAHTEGKYILDVEEEVQEMIHAHKDKMTYLYGPTDNYAPKAFYDALQVMCPEVIAHLAEDDIAHAFVLKSSDRVACKVSEWIKHRN